MRRWRDIGSEMFEPVIDARAEEKMFRGLLEPHEAPAGFAGVAAVLRSAAAVAGAATPISDRARKQRIVASMVSIISSDHPSGFSVAVPPPTLRAGSRRGPVPLLPRLRLVAVAVVGFLFASMGLAFAGALPGPAQNVASSLLSHVGIHVPKDHATSATHGSTGGAPVTEPGSGSGPSGGGTKTGPGPSDPGRGHHGRHGHGNEGEQGHHGHHRGHDGYLGHRNRGEGNGNGRGHTSHGDSGRRSHGSGRGSDSSSHHGGGHGHSHRHGKHSHD